MGGQTSDARGDNCEKSLGLDFLLHLERWARFAAATGGKQQITVGKMSAPMQIPGYYYGEFFFFFFPLWRTP